MAAAGYCAVVPAAAGAFARRTFAVIERALPHEIAADITYGREDMIPDMGRQMVNLLCERGPLREREAALN